MFFSMKREKNIEKRIKIRRKFQIRLVFRLFFLFWREKKVRGECRTKNFVVFIWRFSIVCLFSCWFDERCHCVVKVRHDRFLHRHFRFLIVDSNDFPFEQNSIRTVTDCREDCRSLHENVLTNVEPTHKSELRHLKKNIIRSVDEMIFTKSVL